MTLHTRVSLVFTLACAGYAGVAVVRGVAGAQDAPELSRAVATAKAWEILTSAVKASGARDQGLALAALAAARSPRARARFYDIATNGSRSETNAAIWYLPGEPADVPLLSRALQEPDLAVRQRAVSILGRVRDARSLALLLNILRGGDPDLGSWAVGSAGLLAPLSLPMLLECLDTCGALARQQAAFEIEVQLDPDLRRAAADSLKVFRGLKAEPALVRALEDSSRDMRVSAALTLARLGSRAGVNELVRATLEAARSGTVHSKQRAAAALVVLGRLEHLPLLLAGLKDADPQVGWDTTYAMTSFPDASMREALTAQWHGTSEIRYGAFKALLAAGGATDRAVLREGLGDRDPNIRLRAAEARLALGFDRDSVETLEKLALQNAGTRNLALSFLSAKGDPRRTGAVARALLPKSAADFRQELETSLSDPEDRLAAIVTLGVVRDREAVPNLAALLGVMEFYDQQLVRALVAIGDDTAGRALVMAMSSSNSGTRICAAGGVISVYDQ